MPYSLTFQLGPIILAAEGIPDSIDPQSVSVDFNIYDHYYADPPAAFVRHFVDLGGLETFPDTKPVTSSNCVKAQATGVARGDGETKATGELALFIPPETRERYTPVLVAALERVGRTPTQS